MPQDKLDLPATLFLHTFVPESDIKKVLSFFGPITICLPWHMAPPAFVSELSSSNLIRLSTPPDALRPDDDFKIRLAEYRAWIEENRDKDQYRSNGQQHGIIRADYLYQYKDDQKNDIHPKDLFVFIPLIFCSQ